MDSTAGRGMPPVIMHMMRFNSHYCLHHTRACSAIQRMTNCNDPLIKYMAFNVAIRHPHEHGRPAQLAITLRE